MGIVGYDMHVIAIHGVPYLFRNSFSMHRMVVNTGVQADDGIYIGADGYNIVFNHDDSRTLLIAQAPKQTVK